MGFVFSYSFAGFWISIFACHPIRRVWDIKLAQDHSGKSGICVDRNMLSDAVASLNIVSDAMMLILPIPLVWKLQLPLSQRISIIAMFGIACLSVVATMVRLNYSHQLKKYTDLTWIQLPPIMWAVIELWTGLICGCVPAMRPLLRYFPKVFGHVSLSSFNLSRKKGSKGSSKGSKGSSLPGMGSGNGKRYDSSGSETGLKYHESDYLELSEPNPTHTYIHGTSPMRKKEDWGRENGRRPSDGAGIAKTVEVNVNRSKMYE
ncbi:MAG: hypothetical protein M1836_006462 [Candelina mexicana]|nr:MAG: hypothetical protein M1836_006462 [Candelina mexicana]